MRGDLINRFTAREAERTGKVASGIELGPLGIFTLRVVHPVFEGGRCVGYVELGKEIEDVLQALQPRSGVQLALVIRKEFLSRKGWETGMRMLGRDADWERLPRSVMIYASQGRLPDAFAQWADQLAGEHVHGETDREIAFDGKDWRVAAMPMPEASGQKVGDLLILRDISDIKADFAHLMALGGAASGVLLALLLGFIYVLLRRTDAGIVAQQSALRESEEKYRGIFDESIVAVYLFDDKKNFINANQAGLALLGYSRGGAPAHEHSGGGCRSGRCSAGPSGASFRRAAHQLRTQASTEGRHDRHGVKQLETARGRQREDRGNAQHIDRHHRA
jgi:PAS domain-containing protein